MTGFIYNNGYKYLKRIKRIDEQTSLFCYDYSKTHKCGGSDKDLSNNIFFKQYL